MQFPNAYKGIKKIFVGEILVLIAQVILVPIYIIALLGINGDELTEILETTAPQYLIVLILLAIGAGVFALISYILVIIGVVKATKDENAFKISLLGLFVGIAASIISAIFTGNSMVSAVCSTVSELASLASTFFIIQGIRSIAIKLEDDIMEMKGITIFKIFFFILLLSASTHFVSKAFNNSFGDVVNLILIIAGGILTVVQYILYISYLNKAKKMLEA